MYSTAPKFESGSHKPRTTLCRVQGVSEGCKASEVSEICNLQDSSTQPGHKRVLEVCLAVELTAQHSDQTPLWKDCLRKWRTLTPLPQAFTAKEVLSQAVI